MLKALLVAGAIVGLLTDTKQVTAGGRDDNRPRLALRASPRMAFPPVSVLLVAELKGADPGEEFYCPGLEWDWGDGTRSFEESDCPPFQAGTRPETTFRARHVFRAPGEYDVTVTLVHAERKLAAATISVILHGAATQDATDDLEP